MKTGNGPDYFLLITRRIFIFSGELCSSKWCDKVNNHLLDNKSATSIFIKDNVLQFLCLNMWMGSFLRSNSQPGRDFKLCRDRLFKGFEGVWFSPPNYCENEAANQILEDLAEKCRINASIDIFEVFPPSLF